jgi:hypothetical protein
MTSVGRKRHEELPLGNKCRRIGSFLGASRFSIALGGEKWCSRGVFALAIACVRA